MTDKKITQEEAFQDAIKWSDKYVASTYIQKIKDKNAWGVYEKVSTVFLASFFFEPKYPALVIGDTYRFWDDNKDNYVIGKLSKPSAHATNYYCSGTKSWFTNCEPYELIGPVEYRELEATMQEMRKRLAEMDACQYSSIDPVRHAGLKDELSFLTGQQKKLATTVNTIRREDKENKIEHAKIKADYADLNKRHTGLCDDYTKLCIKAAEHAQDSAVLAELLPVCEKLVHDYNNAMFFKSVDSIEKIEKLLK